MLDFREDEFTEKNVIYTVPDIDESQNNNFGALSFFETKKDANFKSNCGFGYGLFESYAKLKIGELNLTTFKGQSKSVSQGTYFSPTSRTPRTKNYQSVEKSQFREQEFYAYYKNLLISKNSDTLPRLRIYTSRVLSIQNRKFSLDPKMQMFLLCFAVFSILLILLLRKIGVLKMRTVETHGEIGDSTIRPSRSEFERVTSIEY